MKKLLIIAILMLALVFTVVACNNDPVTEDTTLGDTTVETPTEAPTAEPEDPTEPEETTEEPEETTAEPAPEETTEAPEETTEEETTEEVTTADPADPVWIADPDAIAGVKGAGTTAYIADAVVMEEGGYKFVRITVNGGDSQFVVGSNLGTMPKYLAISYRANADKDGEMFIGTANGPNGQNDHHVLSWNQDNSWNLMIVDVSAIANVVDGNVGYFRLDPFRDVTDGYVDIEYIAFFNTAEYAAAYAFEMHKAPMWDADKAVVTHQSFDELDKFAGETKIEGVFTPGQASTWDKTLTLADFSVDALRYWGWVGVKGELGQFGYQINGGKAIYDDAWTHATEQGVIDAAAPTGADTASRMQIMISLAGLEGENSIRVLYKTADGVEVCLNEFTVILPVKPKDITDTFTSDVASNEEGTDLQQSDLANFFTVQYGAADPHSVTGGVYAYGGINEMYTDVNGKYAYSVNMLEAAETAMMFVRGTHVVHSVDVPSAANGLYPINNYYETDGNGHMGGAGVYAAIYGGKLNILVKVYSEENLTHIALKKYAVPTDATELTIADDGETLYFLAGGKLLATIALSGETTYEKICDVAEGVAFAKTAVVTLADGTTETIENTMVVSTCASQIGIAVRPAAIKFDSVKVQAFSAIEIPAEFFVPVAKENVALNKPVSADSVENETNIPSNATDGDDTTRWGATPNGEANLIVDLGEVYDLIGLDVYFENAGWEYTISLSQDGVEYTVIAENERHSSKMVSIKGEASARYIKFTRLQDDDSAAHWFSIYEVYAYTKASEEPETPDEPTVEYYDNLTIAQDQWVISGHNTQLNDTTNPMVAAGKVESAALLHQGSIALGEIDLSKYSKVVIYWGSDASQVTIDAYNANANNRFALVNADKNMKMSPDEETIIVAKTYELHGWAVKAFEIDLTGIDYNGPVFLTHDSLPGGFALVSSIEFIGAEIPAEPEA